MFSTLKRISKPGQRVFSGYKNFNKVINILKYNQGTALISTSSGVMSHAKAEKLKKAVKFYATLDKLKRRLTEHVTYRKKQLSFQKTFL